LVDNVTDLRDATWFVLPLYLAKSTCLLPPIKCYSTKNEFELNDEIRDDEFDDEIHTMSRKYSIIIRAH
jgi:hypothetical protein